MTQNPQSKIKAIILDADGVIIGGIEGVNTPYPSKKVIHKIQELEDSGIKVLVCTGKPSFAVVNKILSKISLSAPQVSDGGALVFDPITKEILHADEIHNDDLKKIIDTFTSKNIYLELYTPKNYFVQKGTKNFMTDAHTKLIGYDPEFVDDTLKFAMEEKIIKGIIMVDGQNGKEEAQTIFDNLNSEATLSWGTSPITDPLWYGIITAKGISKETGARKALETLNISFDNVLAVGDSHTDWQFMKPSRYKATLKNGSKEIKDLVKGFGGFISPSVDEDGILKIFEYYDL